MLYDIGIPEIVCSKRLVDSDGVSIKYVAYAKTPKTKCNNPECTHAHKLHKHSVQHNLLHDIRAEGKLVYIDLNIQRYRCPDCGKIYRDEFTFYDMHAHTTNRLRDEFIRRCLYGETYSYIARDYSVSHLTVSSAYSEYMKANADMLNFTYTPEVLGIDEAHIDDNYRLVLTDIKEQRLLDMKKNNHKNTVRAYLKTLDKDICKCVTMDMAIGYAMSVEAILPDATIVIDKFHVVQMLNRCVDRTRKDIQNYYKEQGVSTRRFKQSKFLFMKNWEDLSPNAENIMADWFTDYPELYIAYMVKETFRDIYKVAETKEEASSMFDLWLESVPAWEQFRKVINTFRDRKDHILNFWDYPWTNAYTESVNNQIKAIEKAGRGYRFEALRNRCLLQINTPKPDKFNPRNVDYHEVEATDNMTPEESNIPKKDKYLVLFTKKNTISAVPDLHSNLDTYLQTAKACPNDVSRRIFAYLNAIQTGYSTLMESGGQ